MHNTARVKKIQGREGDDSRGKGSNSVELAVRLVHWSYSEMVQVKERVTGAKVYFEVTF